MRALLLVCSLLVGCDPAPAVPGSSVVDVEPGRVARVEVYLPAGDVDLVAGAPWVRADVAWQGEGEPVLTAGAVDGTLIVRLDCPTGLVACRADLHLRAPADVPVEVHTGDGLVVVEGFTEAVAVEATRGDVVLLDLCGHVDVDAPGGDVHALGLADLASVEVDTDGGEVVLEVPAGAYDLSVVTASGTVEVRNVVPSPDAAARIDVRTGSGDVLVDGV